MPQEREAAPMGAFFKFTELGQSIAGRIAKYGNHEQNGPFVTLAPVLVWPSRGGKPMRYLTAAVGLSTDLKLKVRAEDVGTFMSFTFRDTEPTTKGAALKRFKVLTLTGEEMRELAADADPRYKDEPYRAPQKAAGVISTPAGTEDAEDDGLPF
jgi:hypothetical protein